MSDSSRPHGLQPTRLLRPWDFPGKSTGVGCHRLLCQLEHLLIILCFLIVVKLLSHVQLFATTWIEARQASLSLTISQSSATFTSIELVMPSNHLMLCRLLLLCLQSFCDSMLQVLSPLFANLETAHVPEFKHFSLSKVRKCIKVFKT